MFVAAKGLFSVGVGTYHNLFLGIFSQEIFSAPCVYVFNQKTCIPALSVVWKYPENVLYADLTSSWSSDAPSLPRWLRLMSWENGTIRGALLPECEGMYWGLKLSIFKQQQRYEESGDKSCLREQTEVWKMTCLGPVCVCLSSLLYPLCEQAVLLALVKTNLA